MIFPTLLLSLKLAVVSTLLMVLCSVLLSFLITKLQDSDYFETVSYLIEADIFIPLVLPPTVIGFYLLSVSSSVSDFGFASFAFTFEGLVIGSVIYSLPFVYQPIQNTINAVGQVP
ncbi:MAG: hypothetical protein AB3N26_08510, partial [Vibrio tubiashii]